DEAGGASMTTRTARERERQLRRLASDLRFEAGYGEQKVIQRLKDVPRHEAVAAVERAIDDVRKYVECCERMLAYERATLAALERRRPMTPRGPLRIVER